MDSFYRYYLAGKIHAIDDDTLEKAIESFEGAALKFSADFISDARQRDNYNRNVSRVKDEVLTQVKSGKVSVKEAAEFCYEMRNKIMIEVRAKTSTHGLSIAERKKMISKALEDLLDSKAIDKFGKRFVDLEVRQKTSIHYEIIESSARPNAQYNTRNRVLRVAGKVLIVVTITYAAYEIANAENKSKEVIKQGAVIGGGVVGTILAGSAVIAVCGPGAPVCTIALLLAGGTSFSWLASSAVIFFDEELDEFTKWQVN
ncbi:hypothetical protein B0D71_18820 [Pseudomonas laurylsulfativorans]|uniref:Uncharacterized protein n=1 Tax=Pseudomonas laurylsulfativorans TaxID=1943631 RepID=A0A2S3VL41_9PSED|nr:hypothetical protein [Pseudomonas laurylsulfativorans]POF40533.1 hypothetical protein B0D71_18820 [Pseudomonas laurylsulfativorans]